MTPLDKPTRAVLAQYPAPLASGTLSSLGNHGGFSGARLWQLRGPAGMACLRAWPTGDPTAERLAAIHRWMTDARTAGLTFVPTVFTTSTGPSAVEMAGRLWDLTEWLPGSADDRPTDARLAAACTALARLHQAWAPTAVAAAPCPAIVRRLEHTHQWLALVRSGWRPAFGQDAIDPVRPWAERVWDRVQPHIESFPRILQSWTRQPMPLQACLCDVWSAHVLFVGNTVTGLIDYGNARIDTIAADLARLLGSMVGDDANRRRLGFDAYAQQRPLSAAEEALADVLDHTGALLAAARWLIWLYRDQRCFDDRPAVARRLATLVARIP